MNSDHQNEEFHILCQKIEKLETRVTDLEQKGDTKVKFESSRFIPEGGKNIFQKWSPRMFLGGIALFGLAIYIDEMTRSYFLEEIVYLLANVVFWGGVLGYIIGAVVGKGRGIGAESDQKEEVLLRSPEHEKLDRDEIETEIQSAHKAAFSPSESVEKESFEMKFGGNWLAKIGVTLIVLGVGFFLKWSFDNGLIGPMGRIVIGVISGLGLIGFGNYYMEKYKKYALTAIGGGIATLYFSIFAARNFYELIDHTTAFGIFIFLTIATVFMSLKKNEQVLSWIALVGGFLTPVFINVPIPDYAMHYLYILILDLGILAIAAYKDWSFLNVGAFFLTFFLTVGTFADVEFATGAFFLSAYFLLFLFLSVVHYLIQKKPSSPLSLSIAVMTPLFYFGQMLGFLDLNHLEHYHGIFTLLLAIVYVIMGSGVYLQIRKDRSIIETFFGTAIAFITIAIYLETTNEWTTVLWLLEGALLLFISVKNNFQKLFIGGHIVFLLGVIRYFSIDFDVSRAEYQFLLNDRIIIGLLLWVLSAGLTWFYHQKKKEGKLFLEPLAIYAGATLVLPLIIGSAEIFDFWDAQKAALSGVSDISSIRMKAALSFSFYLFLYAGLLFWIGIWRKKSFIRIAGLSLFGFSILKVFLYDFSELREGYRIASFIVLGIILLAVALWYQKNREIFQSLIHEDHEKIQ